MLGIIGTESLYKSLMGVFNSLIYATKELMPTIFIISIITAMSGVLKDTKINEELVRPFSKFMKNYTIAYFGIGLFMMIISWFFWPSPSIALIGAIFLPIAVEAGLPPIGVATSMTIFGYGIALSSDYIIQAAPKLTSDAAGIGISEVMRASIPLEITMGVVTVISAFYFLRKDMKNGTIKSVMVDFKISHNEEDKIYIPEKLRKVLAVIIILLFSIDIGLMISYNLQGGDATALVGGTALMILSIVALIAYRDKVWEKVTSNIVDGLMFGFKIFGVIIPVAAFFYMGDSAITKVFGEILPLTSKGIVNDLGAYLAYLVPVNKAVSAITLTGVGAITGLDGSGFSGIPLVGSIARLFAGDNGSSLATLTALGQISGIWIGGGTIVPWAVIPAAAICGLSPFEVAKRNLKPVLIGLGATTLVAILII
ncbi:MAG: hypothetical protein AB2369_12595 [Clostridium sp.]